MDGYRISELAGAAGVATSTVRYYERIGLVAAPGRTPAGYRSYSPAAALRLKFITRAKALGLSLEQVGELLGVWDGTNCAATQSEIAPMLDAKLLQVRDRIAELASFAAELELVRAKLCETAAPAACAPDLDCCAPSMSTGQVAVMILPKGLQ